MSGLSIRRVGYPGPGTWYSFPGNMPKGQWVRETLLAHHANCGREQVTEEGITFDREIPASEYLVAFGTDLKRDADGNLYVQDAELVDAGQILVRKAA